MGDLRPWDHRAAWSDHWDVGVRDHVSDDVAGSRRVTLPQGRTLVLRPVSPDDVDGLAALYEGLAPTISIAVSFRASVPAEVSCSGRHASPHVVGSVSLRWFTPSPGTWDGSSPRLPTNCSPTGTAIWRSPWHPVGEDGWARSCSTPCSRLLQRAACRTWRQTFWPSTDRCWPSSGGEDALSYPVRTGRRYVWSWGRAAVCRRGPARMSGRACLSRYQAADGPPAVRPRLRACRCSSALVRGRVMVVRLCRVNRVPWRPQPTPSLSRTRRTTSRGTPSWRRTSGSTLESPSAWSAMAAGRLPRCVSCLTTTRRQASLTSWVE